jgi:hypothetical protein
MTNEERKAMFESMHMSVHNSFKRIEKRILDASEIQVEDMCRLADIMKDLSEVEKNIAKIKAYEKGMHFSDEVI